MSKKEVKTKNGKRAWWREPSTLWGIFLFVFLIFVDQITKALADAYFSQPDAPNRIVLIPGWINLCITYNRGISYGMGATAPTWAKIAVIVGTGVLMTLFAVFFFKVDKRRVWLRIAIVCVVAGGVGNLIDRVYYQVWDPTTTGGVRDMVDLSRFGFAVCNFADFFITGGAVALILALLFFDKDAIMPVGKYRALAKEAQEADKKKKSKEWKKLREADGKQFDGVPDESERDNG